jgi:hypothetical protein
MWTRLLVIASLLLFGAATDASHIKAARVTFATPTVVCGMTLVGDYVIVHDEEKMAAGEPCTTIYRMGGPEAKAVVSFHCVPHRAATVNVATLTTVNASRFGNHWVQRLVEFQLPGETEAHGVPK